MDIFPHLQTHLKFMEKFHELNNKNEIAAETATQGEDNQQLDGDRTSGVVELDGPTATGCLKETRTNECRGIETSVGETAPGSSTEERKACRATVVISEDDNNGHRRVHGKSPVAERTTRKRGGSEEVVVISEDESSGEMRKRKRRREFPGFNRNYYYKRFLLALESMRNNVTGYGDRLIETRDRILEVDNIGEESDEFFRGVIIKMNQIEMLLNKVEKDLVDTNRFQL